MPTPTARDVCERALLALNVLAAGEVLGADDAVFMLAELNDLLDEWNADAQAVTVYGDVFTLWTLTASLDPHTIGPTGTLVTAQRPATIESASVRTGATVWADVTVRDATWWQGLSVPGLTAPQPTDLYYAPAWPNGTLNFWPVPSTAAAIELRTRQVLAQLALTDTFTLPPGFRSAITKTLAERVASAYEKPVPTQLAKDALAARGRIFAVHTAIPRLMTRDAGMPSSGRAAALRENRGGSGAAASRWSE